MSKKPQVLQCCQRYLYRQGCEQGKKKKTAPSNHYVQSALYLLTPDLQLVGTYKELKLKDLLHARGMFQDQVYEGPDEPERLSNGYKPPPGQPKGNDDWRSDGMFIIAVQREEELEDMIGCVKDFFHIGKENASAEITLTKEGHLRNADGSVKDKRHIPDEKDKTKTRLENLRGKEQ